MDDSSASGPKSRKGDEEKGCLQPCPLSRTIKKEMSVGVSFLILRIESGGTQPLGGRERNSEHQRYSAFEEFLNEQVYLHVGNFVAGRAYEISAFHAGKGF